MDWVRIAQAAGLSRATVSRILCRLKLNRIRDLEPKLPVQRYEHAAPGDLLHLDIKRLVRIQRPSHRVTGDGREQAGEIVRARPARQQVGRYARDRTATTFRRGDATTTLRRTGPRPSYPGADEQRGCASELLLLA